MRSRASRVRRRPKRSLPRLWRRFDSTLACLSLRLLVRAAAWVCVTGKILQALLRILEVSSLLLAHQPLVLTGGQAWQSASSDQLLLSTRIVACRRLGPTSSHAYHPSARTSLSLPPASAVRQLDRATSEAVEGTATRSLTSMPVRMAPMTPQTATAALVALSPTAEISRRALTLSLLNATIAIVPIQAPTAVRTRCKTIRFRSSIHQPL